MTVYVLSNPSFKEGIYKIGYSKNVNARLKQLYDTNVPTPFCKELCFEGDTIMERLIHDELRNKRVNSKREFFRLDLKDFVRIATIYTEQITYVSPKLFKWFLKEVEIQVIKDMVENLPISNEINSCKTLDEVYPVIRTAMFHGVDGVKCHFKSKKTAWMALYICGEMVDYYTYDYWELIRSAVSGDFNCDFSTLEAIESIEELISNGFIKVENDVVTILNCFAGDLYDRGSR